MGGLLVEITPEVLAAYRRAFRGPEWQAVSLEVRVVANECAACHRRPTRPSGLQCAHLVSEVELFALGLRRRFLLDLRNLRALCRPCHRAFDYHVGAFNPRRVTPGQATRLRRRFAKYEGAFRRLALERMQFAALAFAEEAAGRA